MGIKFCHFPPLYDYHSLNRSSSLHRPSTAAQYYTFRPERGHRIVWASLVMIVGGVKSERMGFVGSVLYTLKKEYSENSEE